MVDDYYEEKVRADITARGLKPGDPAAMLLDQQAAAAAEASAANNANAAALLGEGKGGVGGGGGLYRTGGPTTVFGGTGLGPFSDGPLNAVRKSVFTRAGLQEENWMAVIAEHVREADSEWIASRRAALSALGGLTHEDTGKRPRREEDLPLGVYEPHSGLVHCEYCV